MGRIARRIAFVALAAVSLGAIAGSAGATTFDEHVDNLRGDNDVLRSLARQWIPREGAKAVRPVLPLIYHENAAVSWAAVNVIKDIANDVSTPGREEERAVVSAALLEALADTDVQEHQFTLLRILPIVVPEGAGVGPIAALLQQDNTRERARRALQEVNTSEAREALRSALATADPEFACALMDALDKTGDTAAYPLLRDKLNNGTDGEKAHAALALARSADPALVQPYLELCSTIDINERPDAEDAALRLGKALCTEGGRWEAGMALYRGLLEQSKNPTARGGALAGLGRYGDDTAFNTIMAAWAADDSGLLEAPAMAAIEMLQDPGVAGKLMAAFDGQPPVVQERLLGIMGRKQDARYLPFFERAEGIGPAARIDAIEQSQLPGAISVLETMAKGNGDVAAMASGALARMAATFQRGGDGQAAGRAYLALYRVTPDGPEREQALEEVKRHPVAEAYDELKHSLGEENLLALPAPVLAGMARSLAGAGREAEANALREALVGLATDTSMVQELIQLGPVDGDVRSLARRLGFINQWKIVAPFPLAGAPDDGSPVLVDGNVDLNANYSDGGLAGTWVDKPGDGAQAIVNLAYLDIEQSRAFAYAVVAVDSAQEAVLRIGSDDGVRAWINGAKVHDNPTDRGVALDSDLVPVTLKAGDNTVLLEIIQHGGGWGFCARFTQPNGKPLAFTQK